MKDVISEKLKEQADLERKLAKLAKQMDHLERARREEEVPYLQAAYSSRMEEDRAAHEAQQKAFLETHRCAARAHEVNQLEQAINADKVRDG